MYFPSLKHSLFLAAGLLLMLPGTAFTQDTVPQYDAYFVAPSEGQLDQVWGLTLADARATVITHDPWGVANYTISPDHTQIAYVNSGAVWLQTFAGAAVPQKLVTIEEDQARVSLVFTPDGNSLVYGNKGVSILNLATGKSETLLTDILFIETNDPAQVQDYSPVRFLDDDRLLVNIELWEGQTAAIYALSSHTLLQTPVSYSGLHITALEDGRYLYYTTSRMGLSIDAFLIGTPSADPQTPFELVPLLADDFAAQKLTGPLIADVVEIAPGQIRFLGSAFRAEANNFVSFFGEYDFGTKTLMLDTSEVTTNALFATAYLDMFSPDGHYVAGYANSSYEGQNSRGQLTIADLETMSATSLETPLSVMHFQWATQ